MATQGSSAERAQGAVDEAGAVVLDIRCIKPYERNPRRCKNPEYERIKASIRASGLDQPLVVTQRPGDTLTLTETDPSMLIKIDPPAFLLTRNDPIDNHS